MDGWKKGESEWECEYGHESRDAFEGKMRVEVKE